MAFDLSATSLVIDWAPASERDEVIQNVKFILGTVYGTVPLARGIGVDSGAVDAPASKARALLMTSTLRAIQRYEARARVVEMYVDDNDAIDGKISPRVRVEI